MLGRALSCCAVLCQGREGKGVGEGLCRGSTSQIPSIERYLPIRGQNCVRVCPGSFRVSSNNAALGSPGSSVALAINHPLTVWSCEGGTAHTWSQCPLLMASRAGGLPKPVS